METGSIVQSVTCSSVITGRRVRFHKTGGECCLNLCELQIYVCSPGWYGAECDKRCLAEPCYLGRCDQQTGLCTECGGHLAGEYCQFENIAVRKNYSMSSKNTSDGQFSESDAANGNTSLYFPGNCVHTADGDPTGWWEIDLGTDYPVYSIKIWGRHNHLNRMYPFTITVDETSCTSMENGQLVQSVTCSSVIMGRRVRFRRTVGTCCLNLCELQIYVCPDGYYGVSCLQPCSLARCQRCHRLTGQCLACKDSYNLLPPSCTDCQDKTYGEDCSQRCGHCKNGDKCHPVTGDCPSACDPGYLDKRCLTACQPGFYGEMCNQTCGHCKAKIACSHLTGLCSAGCDDGYTGDLCTEAMVSTENSQLTSAVIAGSVVGGTVLFILLTIVIVWQKRRHTKNKNSDQNDSRGKGKEISQGADGEKNEEGSTEGITAVAKYVANTDYVDIHDTVESQTDLQADSNPYSLPDQHSTYECFKTYYNDDIEQHPYSSLCQGSVKTTTHT